MPFPTINNGDTGLQARTKLNNALAEVRTEAEIKAAVGLEAGKDAMPADTVIPDATAIKAAVGLEPGQLTGPTATFVRNANGSTKDSIYGDIPDDWKDGANTLTNLSLGSSVTTIGSFAFNYCNGLTGSLTIPNSVTSIGTGAFQSCSSFTGSLTIPDSVTTIGDYAFYYCENFTGSLTLPTNPLFTSIGSYAFYYCRGLTGSLTIPNSVTSIGSYAFYFCTNLTNVDCYVTRTIMNASNCLGSSGVTTINVPTTGAVADTWTAGADTIGGKAVTVSKTL